MMELLSKLQLKEKVITVLRNLYDRFVNANTKYRKMRELEKATKGLSGYKSGKIKIWNWVLEYTDIATLKNGIVTQVIEGLNDFKTNEKFPRILDCGANIGISVLRYKQLYPNAHITAFEPHPALCETLRKNVRRNGAEDVEVVEAAVWTERARLLFYDDTSDGGHLFPKDMRNAVYVDSVPFADYLFEPIDFVKLDIEGAELEVLKSCEGYLHNVKRMIVEVHYHVDDAVTLAAILSLLDAAGFKVAVERYLGRINLKQPFERNGGLNADQYLLLFAWR